MTSPEFAKMSTKGQIVLPLDIRQSIKAEEGTIFEVVSRKNIIVLKKVDSGITKKDLKLLNELKDAWKEVDSGKARKMSLKDFKKQLKRW